jgi:lipid A disaccharide synthetase
MINKKLKNLQEELKNLQESLIANAKKEKVNKKAKPKLNNINKQTKLSHTPIIILYIISWIAFIISKLPFITKYSSAIKLIIGKTTF